MVLTRKKNKNKESFFYHFRHKRKLQNDLALVKKLDFYTIINKSGNE